MKKQQTSTTPEAKGLHTNGCEIQYLQNAADDLGLIIHEKFTQDKRQTVKKYFAQKGNVTVSPVLDYEQLNHFLLGYRKAVNERQALLDEINDLKGYQAYVAEKIYNGDDELLTYGQWHEAGKPEADEY